MCVFICSVVCYCVLCLSHLHCLYLCTLNVYCVTLGNKYSLLMYCIKIKAPRNFYLMSNMFLWVEIFLFFVCYHVVPKRYSQLDYELNGL